jgi:regulator of sigma E protease
MVSFLQDFWWFLVLIGVMILLHELGHYLVGRFFDVKIDAFSIGFGPACSVSAAVRPISRSA